MGCCAVCGQPWRTATYLDEGGDELQQGAADLVIEHRERSLVYQALPIRATDSHRSASASQAERANALFLLNLWLAVTFRCRIHA